MYMGVSPNRNQGGARVPDVPPPEDRIILRQSWLGDLAMCPERARQTMLGISENTDSTSTVLGSAVHYGIEQCLLELMLAWLRERLRCVRAPLIQ